MKYSIFHASRQGGRARNEDRASHCQTRSCALLMLADGMGGHPDGDVAAQTAVDTLTCLFQKAAQPRIADPRTFLEAGLMAAHQAILRHATDRAMLETPRTTLVAVLLQDGKATWAHCGDSRLYIVRDGTLLMRTRDHSFAERRASNPAVSAADPGNRNLLFGCLGSSTDPMFDLSDTMTLREGDRLLLCSDGLWGNLSDAELLSEMARARPVTDLVPALLGQALRSGGRHCDNVTALALEWEMPGTPAPRAEPGADDPQEALDYLSTLEGVADEPVSGDDFDEAAIERSIAEINEAIRRSVQRKS